MSRKKPPLTLDLWPPRERPEPDGCFFEAPPARSRHAEPALHTTVGGDGAMARLRKKEKKT